MKNVTRLFCLLLLCFGMMHPASSYAMNSSYDDYALTGANAPIGPATYCSGAVSYTCTDMEASCSNSYGGNTNTISWHWTVDGVAISGATGSYVANGTAHTVTLSSMPVLTAGTHTLNCIFTPNQSNCGFYSYAAITSPPLTITAAASGPAPITGFTGLCAGTTTYLSDATPGGVWSSSNTAVATVSGSGVVYGVSGGTTNIYYTAGSGCPAGLAISLLTPISGSSGVCTGSTINLSDATTGGVWSSSNTAVATVSATRVVTGISSGTSNISYTLGSCSVGMVETASPPISAITGATSVCTGSTIYLTDATAGGAWTSGNTTIATVSGTGVTGVGAGTVNITYAIGGGCPTTYSVSVPAIPAITGNSVCLGSTASLADGTTGGTWSSSNTAAATITATGGVVYGVALGTTSISYLTPGGCIIGETLTVDPAIPAITGATHVCRGGIAEVSDAMAGGVWSSSSIALATVSGTGVVYGIGAGTVSISYTSGGCSITKSISVSTVIPAIAGLPYVCIGSPTYLSDGTAGGTWSSSNTSVATVSTAGVVTGITAGTANITYTTSSCVTDIAETIGSPIPPISAPTTNVCPGSTIALSDATGGGVWGSSNTSIAVVSATGLVTGVSGGTVSIYYTVGSSCPSVLAVTVYTLDPIHGATAVCAGSTITLSDPTIGGIWSSSNSAVATISALGILTGASAGTTNISYTVGYCSIGVIVTVNSIAPITGPTSVCTGYTIALSDLTAGGTWSSSAPAKATVGATTGIVTGVSSTAPAPVITYISFTGCSITTTVTVSPISAITGMAAICASGGTVTLHDATTGGLWSSSGGATVNSTSGLVTGVSAGTAGITYTMPTGCTATTTLTVSTGPAAITGTTAVCVGFTTALSDAIAGGTWSSSAAGKATVSAAGIVTGVSSGTAVISYGLAGCTATTTVTVNSMSAITGMASICASSGTVTLHDATTGGTWSATGGTATIGSTTGVVTGVSAGVAYITYSVAGVGCTAATASLTVNPAPTAIIGGPASVCVGATITLSDATPGGIWDNGGTGGGGGGGGGIHIATVGSSSGLVTGVASGSAIIQYYIGSCAASTTVTVGAISAITGAANICVGGTVTLHDATTGGTWSASGGATVGATSGLVTGVSAGAATITYTTAGGCSATATLTVNALPAAITNGTAACVGAIVTLSDATAGGAWSADSNGVATVGASTGIVYGVTGGTTVITYTVAGCITTTTLTVNGPQTPQICVVDVDSASGKNLVIWEQLIPNRVEQFNIYRENSSSVFVKIDSQANNVFSTYLDMSSYPVLQSYSYQLTATDSCGNESPLASSTIHTTVHLSANLGVGGAVNLIWNTYIGKTVTTQQVMRSMGGAPYVNIASVANTVTSYTDATPPSGTLVYEINSVMASGCSPSARTTAYEIVSSNPIEIASTGINTIVNDPGVEIYPNPASTALSVNATDNITNIIITNIVGQTVYTNNYNTKKLQVDVSGLASGVYFIKVNVGIDGVTVTKKFVKE